LPHLTVLVVEDELLAGAMIQGVLEAGGFRVNAVATARDALRYMASGAAADLLFTDINLPGDMDGAALAVAARALRPDLPVVYASGRVGPEEIDAVPDSLFLRKPFDPSQLCTLLLRAARPHPAPVWSTES
jgi:CheY-like chemotaxis protein